jgi:hypothetical protein
MEAIILAAKRLSIASSTRPNADNGDGGAGKTNDGVHILDDDTEEGELLSDCGIVGRAGGVAALHGGGIALGSWGRIVGEGAMGVRLVCEGSHIGRAREREGRRWRRRRAVIGREVGKGTMRGTVG